MRTNEQNVFDLAVTDKSFEEHVINLLAAKPMFCPFKQEDVSVLAPPSVFIIDVSEVGAASK